MRILRYTAPSLSALFSFYCVIWGLITPSLSTLYRIDSIFLGGLLLLLAFVHFRFTFPLKQGEVVLLERNE
ncbi:hypothetical protein KSZ_57070 [Dictyobacter formicarum]|uniref:Uncharacterized protein n=1 Tax=Dictyobacter formicarum TaxID=2778368 RepID=A0ABQ3VQU8_9CHLR|nr:hypothetical protein KSZ_57070 [Dictyobacter formicarum]